MDPGQAEGRRPAAREQKVLRVQASDETLEGSGSRDLVSGGTPGGYPFHHPDDFELIIMLGDRSTGGIGEEETGTDLPLVSS